MKKEGEGKGKEKKQQQGNGLPLEQEGRQPCWHLDFSPVNQCWTSNVQNCEILYRCCFKPLSLWEFVAEEIENQ